REQLALTEFRHVRQDRHVDTGGELLELAQVAHGLGEDQDRAGGGIGLRPVDRRVEALAGTGVGASADDEVLVAAALDGGFYALGHLGGGDDLLAVELTAALRADLVLE